MTTENLENNLENLNKFEKFFHRFKIHNWKIVDKMSEKSIWGQKYYECKCGKRKVHSSKEGYIPVDMAWLHRDPKLALDYNNPPKESGTPR